MAIEAKPQGGELLGAISNMVVGVYADCLGKGPTRARSVVDHDVVLCLLENTLTKPERLLLLSEQSSALLTTRTLLQNAMRKPLIAGVEQLTGRRVETMVSGRQLEPDLMTEVFVLGGAVENLSIDKSPSELSLSPQELGTENSEMLLRTE